MVRLGRSSGTIRKPVALGIETAFTIIVVAYQITVFNKRHSWYTFRFSRGVENSNSCKLSVTSVGHVTTLSGSLIKNLWSTVKWPYIRFGHTDWLHLCLKHWLEQFALLIVKIIKAQIETLKLGYYNALIPVCLIYETT